MKIEGIMNRRIITDKEKKTEIISFSICVAVTFVVVFWMLWDGHLKNVIPHTRTRFLSYSSFRREEQSAVFPDELPRSTKSIRYYCYRGYQDSKIGVSFIIEEDVEYDEMKALCLGKYVSSSADNKDELYRRYLVNQPLTREFLDENDLSFIDTLLLNEASDYKIVVCENLKQSITNRIDIILCNNSTNEIIVVKYRDTHHSQN